MKVSRMPEGFKPFSITITFDTEAEAAEFYAIVSSSTIQEALPHFMMGHVCNAMHAGNVTPISWQNEKVRVHEKLRKDFKAYCKALKAY